MTWNNTKIMKKVTLRDTAENLFTDSTNYIKIKGDTLDVSRRELYLRIHY